MLKVNCHIDRKAIVCGQKIMTKYDILAKIASLASSAYNVSEPLILESLLERESLGSTGFGGSIAIPHCKLDGIDAPMGVFMSLDKAVEYESIDDQPVDLIFALLSPSHNGAAHLHALAEVSRLLRDEKSCARLRGAKNGDSIFALLSVAGEADDDKNSALSAA